LVLGTLDIGIVHRLRIELDYLLGESSYRTEAYDPMYPGLNVVDAAHEGWSEPAFGLLPVLKPGLPVPCLALPPVSTYSATVIQCRLNDVSSVLQLSSEYHFAGSIIDDCDPGDLAAWI